MRFVIVIPTSDAVATIRDSVESALNQDYTDYSVVVSDNASTDGTREYISSLRSPRLSIAVTHDKRIGKSQNWNRAFQLAPPCDFMVMLHSDDILAQNALAKISSYIERRPGGLVYFGNHDRLSLDGRSITVQRIWPYGYGIGAGLAETMLCTKNVASVVGLTIRQSAYLQLGGFAEHLTYLQDQDLVARAARIGVCYYIPARLGCYRDSPIREIVSVKWVYEEMDYTLNRVQLCPWFLRGIILSGRLAGCYNRIMQEAPSHLVEFRRKFPQKGGQARRRLRLLNAMVLSRLLKLSAWLNCSLSGMRPKSFK